MRSSCSLNAVPTAPGSAQTRNVPLSARQFARNCSVIRPAQRHKLRSAVLNAKSLRVESSALQMDAERLAVQSA